MLIKTFRNAELLGLSLLPLKQDANNIRRALLLSPLKALSTAFLMFLSTQDGEVLTSDEILK
jgi:hypothetical protein